eukprot:Tbor_TRINITY_DN4958_c0_g1::TRINITY_DN4958_c0_g1_i1::g.9618::m.9618/K01873/VARS, valS; valyl-tRNA synthetase
MSTKITSACPMKTFTAEMDASYDPAAVEQGWYSWWEESGFFKPKSDTQELLEGTKKFVIILPPPNVTGYLHLGHALTGAVQDSVVRYQRMRGRDVLYLPGTDHAGISMQVMVEKRVLAATNKNRHDIGREDFVKKIWEFKNDHAGMITKQLRCIGSSLDWSRERFTMDEGCTQAVNEAFVKLHEDGLVYRATRLVNWCCALQSAISDLEVETEEVLKEAKFTIPNYAKKVQMGTLTHFAYKIVGSDDEIVVATTRPETILGDTAVAVHPNDARYTKYHGMKVMCPFRNDEIPIVCDEKLVDMAFGTGAVKLTPAHDKNDFEAGQRHNLRQIVVFDMKGNICIPNAEGSEEPQFFGMHRFDCRTAIVKALEAKGLLRGVEPYAYRIGRCARTKDIIEPMMMPQWYVDCNAMAAKSVEAVEKKELKLIPDTHESTWYHFLKNVEPWCVSRQLWWGHRVPAYKVSLNGIPVADDNWVVARSEAEARVKSKNKYNLSDEDTAKLILEQDPDVLDTWFSSALWPFSTMGWPSKTNDLERFFPGNLLESGHDILFFWIARMVMMSLHFTGKLPFTEVFLHAMVRDRDGRKMSKSLGNVIDPLDVINGITLTELQNKNRSSNLDEKEIPKADKFQLEAFPNGIPACGSDALRFGLLSYTQSGRNVNLDINRIVSYRQFCNKLWNVVKYILYFALPENFKPKRTCFKGVSDLPLECGWILSRLDYATSECVAGFAEGVYDFSRPTQSAYSFWLYDLCDVYLELSKTVKALPDDDHKKIVVQDVLLYCVEAGLRMLHPMMPFVTEELYHRLPHFDTLGYETIMLAQYPSDMSFRNTVTEEHMKAVMDCVSAARSMKASYQLTYKVKPDVWISCTTDKLKLIAAHTYIVEALGVVGNVVAIENTNESEIPAGCGMTVISKELILCMMLKGSIDVDAEIKKLDKAKAMLNKQLEVVAKKMGLANYETKVPESVRKADAEKKESLMLQIKQNEEGIVKMSALKA